MMRDYLPLADQIQILFEAVRHPDGRSYTLQEVSEQTQVSLATLSQLRTGRIKNPQLSTLRALCAFFQVPLRYFDTRTTEECYAIVVQKEEEDTNPALNEISFRATHLSPEAQEDILKVIQWVQAAEELRKQGIDLPPLPGLSTEPAPDNGTV
jgi:transcriptional regulator with XRE-family HTH domain